MRGVFSHQGDLQGLLQGAGILLAGYPIHQGKGQFFNAGQGPEDIFHFPLVDGPGGTAAVDVGDPVFFGDHGMGCDQRGSVTAEQGVHLIFGDQLLVELNRRGIIALIVIDNELNRDLFAVLFDHDAAGIIDLFDGHFVALLEVAPLAGLTPGDGQGRPRE